LDKYKPKIDPERDTKIHNRQKNRSTNMNLINISLIISLLYFFSVTVHNHRKPTIVTNKL